MPSPRKTLWSHILEGVGKEPLEMTLRKKNTDHGKKVEDSETTSELASPVAGVPVAADLKTAPPPGLEQSAARTRKPVLGMKRKANELLTESTGGKDENVKRTNANVITEPEAPIPKYTASLTTISRLAEEQIEPSPASEEPQDVSKTSPEIEKTVEPEPNPTILVEGYSFTIVPLMGKPFEVKILPDSTLFDLKDAICTKNGMMPEMQLLAYMKDPKMDFSNEDTLLEDLKLPKQCTLHLTVRAATGIQVMSTVNFDEDEYFIYDFATSSTGTGTPANDSDSDDSETEAEEKEKESFIATATLPLPVLQSYAKRIGEIGGVDDDVPKQLHFHIHNLESLRISASSDSEFELPTRPSTPAPPAEVIISGPTFCHECGKRCRLASQFLCRCGNKFCPEHRYPDKHQCSFDHKSHDRAKLDTANPKVQRNKLEQL